MANVFDGINKLSDDEIRMTIALMQEATLLNAAKETGHRLLSGVADVVNAFAETFTNKSVIEYDIKRVSDITTDTFLRLSVQTREELLKELRDNIISTINTRFDMHLEETISDEKLSKIIVDIAARTFSIDNNKTVTRKIISIKEKYNENYLKTLHAGIVRLEGKELRKAEELIDKRLAAVSIETKRMLQSALVPKAFNGKGIIAVLKIDKNNKHLAETITILGESAFDSTDVEVRSIFQLMRTLNRVSRIHFARLVWMTAKASKNILNVNQDSLPSYTPANERESTFEKDKAFSLLMDEVKEAKKNVDKMETELDEREKNVDGLEDDLQKAQDEVDRLKGEFAKLDAVKVDYMEGKKPEGETKSFYSRVNEVKRQLDRAEADYKRIETKFHSQGGDFVKADKELGVAKAKLNILISRVKEEAGDRAVELKKKWMAYYYKFKIEDKVYIDLVSEFKRDEILNIEEYIKEVHDAGDYRNYATEEIEPEIEEDTSDNISDEATNSDSSGNSEKTSDVEILKNAEETTDIEKAEEEDDSSVRRHIYRYKIYTGGAKPAVMDMEDGVITAISRSV